ncbi:hypothetical protein [Paenibacillus sp. FSL H3-0286]|uniref:hypothetical protein n=1 Tax=Paenibacillus sp. FSL H3-0286 TaxID=2921427 RepID=UPI003251F817
MEMKTYNTVDDLLKDYGMYAGLMSLESLGDTPENKENYIVYPDDYISEVQEWAELPSKEIVKEFFDKFYDEKSAYLLLENINWDN